MSQDLSSLNTPYLVVGLGNPGPRYAATRHNAGFMAVDRLARLHGLKFSGKQANAEVARGRIGGTPVVLAKPLTYMNESGRAVGSLARFYKLPLDHVLVLYDDIALPLGTIRIREKGSDGGHNGLTSIIQHLGTQKFPRLRIGVDRPVVPQHSQIDWVLGRFTKDEQPVIDDAISRAAEAVVAVLDGGIERAMNRYNSADAARTEKPTPVEREEKPQPAVAAPAAPAPESQMDQLRRRIDRIMHGRERQA